MMFYKILDIATENTILSAGVGAAAGAFAGKTATYSLHSTLTSLFFRCVHPYTIQKPFMNENSNNAALFIGLTLSLVSGVTIPYFLTQYLTSKIPFLTQENKGQPFTAWDAIKASTAAFLCS